MGNRKFGWHSGKLTCKELDVLQSISMGSLDFGAAELDSLLIKGRIATSTIAGAALSLPAEYIYGEAAELRWDVASWTGTGNSFNGLYLRTSTSVGNASGGLQGAQIMGVFNVTTGTTGLSSLKGLYVETLVKANTSGNKTITNLTSVEANISLENYGATVLTFTNNIYCLHAKAQTGTGLADYTKVNGIKISGRDDGTARVFGIGLDISDPEATVATWTTGISITTSATTGISLATGTFTTGISIAGTTTTGISITANPTTGIALGTSGTPLTYGTVTNKAATIYSTCSTTNGSTSFEPVLFSTTMTGAGQVGGRVRAYMTTNVALGGWSNAFKAEVTYGASGSTTGLGSALLGEMTLSAGTTSGNYAPLELELNVASGDSLGTRTAMQYLSVNGTGVATFDTNGYILNIQGISAAASGKVFQANTATAATHALRIRVLGTDYFMMLTSTGA